MCFETFQQWWFPETVQPLSGAVVPLYSLASIYQERTAILRREVKDISDRK